MNRKLVRLTTSRGSVVGAAARRRMLEEMLDHVLANKRILRLLKAAFERELDENPLRFIRHIVMPLAETQDTSPTVAHDGIVKWRSLPGECLPGPDAAKPIKEVQP